MNSLMIFLGPKRNPGFSTETVEVLDFHCAPPVFVHGKQSPVQIKKLYAVWASVENASSYVGVGNH
jgi:hypothetical protein